MIATARSEHIKRELRRLHARLADSDVQWDRQTMLQCRGARRQNVKCLSSWRSSSDFVITDSISGGIAFERYNYRFEFRARAAHATFHFVRTERATVLANKRAKEIRNEKVPFREERQREELYQ